MKDRTKEFFKVWLKDIIKTIDKRSNTSIEDIQEWFDWIIRDGKQIEGEE